MPSSTPASIDATAELLKSGDYIADRSLATVLYLALKLGRPLFCEGEAGVGKTEIAKVLSQTLKRPLIRLQCYEGLDVSSAVYEWNYARQMIEIRLAEAQGVHDRGELAADIFNAFSKSKRLYVEALKAGKIEKPDAADALHQKVMAISGSDPLPYGVEPNRKTIETLIGHALSQGIITKKISVEDIFAKGTAGLTG